MGKLGKGFLILTCFLVYPALLSAQFYKDYSREERIRLSREYYSIGEYLVGIGREQGVRYLKLAYELDPEFMPYSPKKESNQELNDLIKFRFTRMVCSFVAGDLPHYFVFFDSGFYNGNEKRMYSLWEWMERIDQVMGKTDTSGLSPYYLFDLFHTLIEPLGEYSVLEIKSNLSQYPELTRIFPENQYYLLRSSGGKWVISALFPEFPSATLLKEYETVRDDQEIGNFFLSSVKLFAAKEIKGLLGNFHETVYLLPMKNIINKNELELTFTGLFNVEETPQTGFTPDYHAIRKSLSVEFLEVKPDFIEETDIKGRYALLTVNNPAEKEILPVFFSSYKKYYLIIQNEKYRFIGIE